ncbi:phosphomevalonate kinase isoform X2 [Phlebotomus papatasi]|uniref:phosphomevalonate kinase isoform X2 n=1 Tax=Phlebotomus papatasi TaxID=29031 RepID=UPI002483CD5E|nr:phosphomevalonate kinase isoform X2 [Phlebotomus papatasi]
MESPRILLLFSGKRKSGKDFLTENLLKILGTEKCEIVRISEPIKSFWAKDKNLNLKELLSDGPYKELHRKEMIVWSEEQRAKDYGIFCRKAMQQVTKPICIVSDIRRKTDILWFQENYPSQMLRVRVECSDSTRTSRGWKFQSGIDDAESECDLDNYSKWDHIINNDQAGKSVEEILSPLLQSTDF